MESNPRQLEQFVFQLFVFIRVDSWLKIYDDTKSARFAARLRIAQRDVRGTGRLMANRLAARKGRSRLGRRWEEISGFDCGFWCRGGRPCKPAGRRSWPKTNGKAVARNGRRASTRVEGATRVSIEPDYFREVSETEARSQKSEVRRSCIECKNHFLQFRFRSRRGGAKNSHAHRGQIRRDCIYRRISRSWLWRIERHAPRFFSRAVPPATS